MTFQDDWSYYARLPRTAHSNEIPERLLAAGLALLLRQGYNATGIQQIADAAGVPKGSFYNHFASKESFAVAIVDRYAQHSQLSWERMMSGAPSEPMATIRYVFTQMLAYHERAGVPAGCLIGNLAAEVTLSSDVCRQSLLAAQLAWRERLAGLIQAGQGSGEIRDDLDASSLSGLTWSVWEGALLRMKVEGTAAPVREAIALLLDHMYTPAHRAITGAHGQKRAALSKPVSRTHTTPVESAVRRSKSKKQAL